MMGEGRRTINKEQNKRESEGKDYDILNLVLIDTFN